MEHFKKFLSKLTDFWKKSSKWKKALIVVLAIFIASSISSAIHGNALKDIPSDYVKAPYTAFKSKDMVEEELKQLGITPKFVVTNFDEKADSLDKKISKNMCEAIQDQANLQHFSSNEYKESGDYIKKGNTVIIGYSDHDYDPKIKADKEKAEEDKKQAAKEKAVAEQKAKEKKIKAEQEAKEKADAEKKAKEKAESDKRAKEKAAQEAKDKAEEDVDDITKLATSPSQAQEVILDELANSGFNTQYPYKGSKMKSILGVIQPWTSTDGKTWYKKVDAVINNAFGSKRDTTLEIHITPVSSDSGTVEFVDYGA